MNYSLKSLLSMTNSHNYLLYLQAVICCFLTSYSNPSNAAAISTIKDKLAEIQDHLKEFDKTKKIKITKNHLEGVSFSPYHSKGYLHLYRGIAYSLMALKSKPSSSNSIPINIFKKALRDIQASLLIDGLHKNKANYWLEVIYKNMMRLTFYDKQYFQSLNFIKKLLPHVTDHHEINLYAARCLFETKQYTRLQRLLKEHALLFKKSLKSYPINQADEKLHDLISKLQSPKKRTNSKKQRKSFFPKREREIHAQINKIFKTLNEHYYSEKIAKDFDQVIRSYIRNTSKYSLSSTQKKFLHTFNNNIHNLPPTVVERMIKLFWHNQKLSKALSFSELFLNNFNSHPLYLKVLYNKGRIQEDLKRYLLAADTYAKVTQLSHDTKYFEKSMYRRALVLRVTKAKDAKKAYSAYLKNFPHGDYASTIKYFALDYELKEAKRNGENYRSSRNLKTKVEKFIKQNPLSLYSILVGKDWRKVYHKQFNNLISKDKLDLSSYLHHNTLFPMGLDEQFELQLYHELKALGLEEDSWKVLNSINFSTKNQGLAMYQINEYKDVDYLPKVVISSMLAYLYLPHLRKYLNLKDIFPEFKKPKVKSLMEKYSLNFSPYLIMSLIRQESAFDYRATSPAKASGLMQIIPSTAKMISKRLKKNNYNMHNPEDNLNFGVYYLSGLIKDFENQIIYALSAYNAGPSVAKRWQNIMGHLDPIDFIESIPYNETRKYVKLILRNYAIYQMLYEKKSVTLVHEDISKKKI